FSSEALGFKSSCCPKWALMNTQDGEQGNPAHSLFETFLRANHCEEVLGSFQALCGQLGLEHKGQLQFYHKLKSCLNYWSAKALWGKLDKKAGHKDYDQGKACVNTKCLIIGAGPCGLRTAIELAFLGARVVLVEKRDSFSRNNVLHLWPFTIHDLRALGAKKFYGRFCTGALDHISIRQLQLILLKVALLLGVEIHVNVQFKGLIPPAAKGSGGWKAALQPSSSPVGQYEFDVLISAGGGKFVPEGFKRKETRGKLAIGITTNFVNRHSRAEVEVAEISGVARIYNQQFFQNLYNKTGIDLENIVYYKDDTHYFVMTAKKQSLLKKGVIVQDKADIESLLSAENVNQEALLSYAKEAADFSTNYQLPDLEFALNHRNRPDVDMFDFTCMNRSENAALVRECHGARLLIGLVGDCLVEPFWPLGTGVARGFLAAFDAAWMVKRWAAGTSPLDLLAERESIYQQLSQTSPDNTNKNTSQYSIDPTTRYRNINLQAIKPNQGWVYICTAQEPVENTGMNHVGRAYEELLSWCQTHTAGYRGVTVTDFTHSWKSGLALCSTLSQWLGDGRTTPMALDIAEQELGIPPVLSSTEMASVAEPNQLGLITYLSQFYEAFKPSRARKLLASPGTRGAVLFLSKLQKRLSLTRKRNQVNALSGDACYFCGKRVYILERVSAEGHFFHRGCFQCHQCGTTLRLGDFPQEPGGGLGDRANSLSRQEEQSLRERGSSGAVLRQPSPEPRPPETGPAAPDFRQAEEDGEDTRKRKKIQLSPLEKLKLSTLSLDSETESQGGPGKPRAGSEPFRSAAPANDQGAPERGQVCWVEPGFSEEAEAPWDACPLLTLALVLCFQRFLSLGEKEKYPTWKRTLTRRAKEAEMKRFCKAQVSCPHSRPTGNQSELKTKWMNQLLSLVQKKNSLVSEESDLMIELEEKEILAQLLEVVNQRNALIHVLEEKRLSELSEALPGTAKGRAG
uniref:Molecule interacting with CasL protein 1 n=1 Tax=Chelydra serpentina TaxID=8475 RepID=A0A8C3XL96_CHESE